MKKRLIWCVFIVSIIMLVLLIAISLNINYIKQENNQVEIIGEKNLILKEQQNKVSIPHLNLKGTIKNIDLNKIDIELSDYAKTFLQTTQISIKNENFEMGENQRVIIKFNEINIKEKELCFSSVEVYKHINEIDFENMNADFFICPNDYGGFMKIEGSSFKYKNNIYFKSNYDLSKDNENYFVNIKNEVLLIEEMRSIVFPFKIYNMINPQETQFNEMVEIYKKKEVLNEK